MRSRLRLIYIFCVVFSNFRHISFNDDSFSKRVLFHYNIFDVHDGDVFCGQPHYVTK